MGARPITPADLRLLADLLEAGEVPHVNGLLVKLTEMDLNRRGQLTRGSEGTTAHVRLESSGGFDGDEAELRIPVPVEEAVQVLAASGVPLVRDGQTVGAQLPPVSAKWVEAIVAVVPAGWRPPE